MTRTAASCSAIAAILATTLVAGCGTTRWSDTTRTATEQLLISDAIDRAVSNFDLRALAGKPIYFDTSYLKNTTDADYLVSSIRQHALASGCILKIKPTEADYIVEIRSGGLGTDRQDVLFGIPATNVPSSTFTAGLPASVPELPLVKRTEQRAVAKVGLFAYNRETGRPIWQSGMVPVESSAKDVWVFGAGPFRKGHIHKGMDFAGEKLNLPLFQPGDKSERVSVASEAFFSEPSPAAEIALRSANAEVPRRLPEVGGPIGAVGPSDAAPPPAQPAGPVLNVPPPAGVFSTPAPTGIPAPAGLFSTPAPTGIPAPNGVFSTPAPTGIPAPAGVFSPGMAPPQLR